MIKTVADLLQAFLLREKEVLAAKKLKHGPTIGAMYEGLTRKALDRTIPSTCPLYVSSGFARDKHGKMSNQLDCVLATLPGEEIEYTDARIFPVENIVAVIEVKKTLGRGAIDDGYDNLRSVAELEPKSPPPFKYSVLKTAFQQVTGHPLPDEPKKLPPELYEVYRYLLREALSPVRVLLGYEGYKTAGALRKAALAQVESLIGRQGVHGPHTLPNLIASSHHAVAKMNGMPWGAKHDDDEDQVMLWASSGGTSSASVLLELIWSRLNYLGLLSSVAFGEDLDLEQWVKLLSGKLLVGKGWAFDAMPASVPTKGPATVPWEPIEVSKDESILLSFMGREENHDEFDMDNPRPDDWPPESQLLKTLDGLRKSKLVGIDPARPRVHRLLTRNLVTVWLPDGRTMAGENTSGRMERWLNKHIAESKKK